MFAAFVLSLSAFRTLNPTKALEMLTPNAYLNGMSYWIFAIVLIGYAAILLVIGYLAQRRIENVEDFVLAGRRLRLGVATIAMVAAWFGAESLMTTADEVAREGIRKAMLDPIGISACLLIAGFFVAGPLWRMRLLTIPDFFRVRYGVLAETLSACILVPSYFGWIAAQYLALAALLALFFGVPVQIGVIAIAVLAMSYSLMGGMWSVAWTDVLQMILILLGLLILGFEILWQLGDGELLLGLYRLRQETEPRLWAIAAGPDSNTQVMAALSALIIGSLGNLPIQDLMQRISSAESDRTASRSCIIAAGLYLCLGLLPILAGLTASRLLSEVPAEGVVSALARQLLTPPLLLIFVLAIVSTVLSTVVAAVLAPAAVLSQNLLQPLAARLGRVNSEASKLRLQRLCVLLIVIASVTLALSGNSAFELVESSYSLSLVGLFASFSFGLYSQSVPGIASLASMTAGVGLWLLHIVMDWDYFLEFATTQYSNSGTLQLLSVVPHELGAAFVSVCTFLMLWIIVPKSDKRQSP